MQFSMFPWTTGSTGDGLSEYTQAQANDFFRYHDVQDPAAEGVLPNVLNELEVSGTSSPLSVASGVAVCYGRYWSDGPETLAVATPSVGTTGGRVVLQADWSAQTIRLVALVSDDGVSSPPAVTQNFGTIWEISLATFTITTGGAITVTDDRTFRRATALVGAEAMEDDAVATASLQDSAVTTAKINAAAVTTSKLQNDAVTNTKLRDSAAVSVIGRASNSAGDPADIAASANDRLLARVGDALSFTQLTLGMIPGGLITEAKLAAAVTGQLVTNGDAHDHAGGDGAQIPTAGILNDAIDDTKAGDRVPQFYRRQGGHATHWERPGSTNRTPTAVRMQAGAIQDTVTASSGSIVVQFPVSFSAAPLVFVTSQATGLLTGVTTPGVTFRDEFILDWKTDDGTNSVDPIFFWVAIGAE